MNTKAYPSNIVEKQGDIAGVHLQEYRGSVSALLLQEEVEYVRIALENIFGQADVSEDLADEIESIQDSLIAIMDNGESRMRKLHGLLGAFDLEPDGRLAKPGSEKIDWAKNGYRSPRQKLKLVKEKQTDPEAAL